MQIKNKAASFFAVPIILLIALILYWSTTEPISVVIQAGHEGKLIGNTGAESEKYREEDWNILVADEVAKQLRLWAIDVKRIPARVVPIRAKITVSIHFDGANIPCNSGASIGYPNERSYDFAQKWKNLYSTYYPFMWHEDNFTKNLRDYYAYRWIHSEKFLVMELGEITCEAQTKWLKPRLTKIAHLVAYAIAKELGKDVEKPEA